MSKPTVAFVVNALGLGGTEKGMAEFALGAGRAGFGVRVVAVHESGPREAELREAGIDVRCAAGDEACLADLLRGVDVAHVFRAGNAEPIVPAAARRAGVDKLVESNIFGNVDESADRNGFACHLLGSKMTLLRYRTRLAADSTPDFHRRHRVLSFPIGLEDLRQRAPEPSEARRRLGLDPDRPVVGRVGRADDLKWRTTLVDMVPDLLELVPDAQVLFVGATPGKVARLERLGVRDRCLLVEPVRDLDVVGSFYAACDVFVSAAEIGESQGMAINEAMALGVPVVTCSTPWADNAQVEFVEHGRSGWYAGHPRVFAEAVADLLLDEQRRAAFGRAAAEDMEAMLARGPLVARSQRLYEALAADDGPPDEWEPGADAVEAFAAEYERRAAQEFRPLTARERAEARLLRARERGGHVLGAVRARLPR
jgi:glycosyltransferase involved in cell wall biosynthesis